MNISTFTLTKIQKYFGVTEQNPNLSQDSQDCQDVMASATNKHSN